MPPEVQKKNDDDKLDEERATSEGMPEPQIIVSIDKELEKVMSDDHIEGMTPG